jgi:hypothetical protein
MASAFVHIGLYPVPEVFCPADIFGIKHCGFDVPNLVAAAKAIKIIREILCIRSFHGVAPPGHFAPPNINCGLTNPLGETAAFIGAQSLQKPAEYYDPDATANANLSARLPYLFATCRFAHYLKCIVRDKIGTFKEREDMQRWLSGWIMNYVDADPANSSEDTKSRKPLAAAEVVVEAVEGNPGYYNSKFFLRPHYQLEGLTVSLRLVSKLPSVKAA